jgi:hypothetical protein
MAQILNLNSKRIFDALKQAKEGQEVFDALCEIPSEHLNDLIGMCQHILEHRRNCTGDH